MMRTKTLLLLVIIFIASSASAATRYVSDDLYTYIHAGPGTKYKIIGSVNSGAQIKQMQASKKDGFTKIKDSKGRDGWINSKYVSKYPGLKVRLAKLETQYAKLKTQLAMAKDKSNQDIAGLEDNLNTHSSQVRKLKNTNSILNKELQEVKALNISLNDKLDTEKNDLLMRWFAYGGMVAGIGLLFGLILPSLIPNRRKRSSW